MKQEDGESIQSNELVVLQMKSILPSKLTKHHDSAHTIVLNHRTESPDITVGISLTSSHGSSSIEDEPIAFIQKKSVSFKEETDILLIPTRHEIKYMIQGLHLRCVHFNKVVKAHPVPSRRSLQCIAHELWYNENEIAKMENQVFCDSV